MSSSEQAIGEDEVRSLDVAREQATGEHDDRLIRWMLERTPAQRLRALQGFVDGISELRHVRRIRE